MRDEWNRPTLIDVYGRYDRAAICREAHRQFRQMRALGWSFGRCLGFAWKKAKAMREALGDAPLATRAGNGTPATHRAVHIPVAYSELKNHLNR